METKDVIEKQTYLAYFGGLLLVSGIILACYFAAQKDFPLILLSYALAFGGYSLVLQTSFKNWQLYLACLVACLPLASFPNLSNDIYRFYWDGQLTLHGISPYRYLPESLIHSSLAPAALQSVYPLLNSPNYFSVYPPFCQLIYALSALTYSVFSAAIAMKIIYLIFHLFALKTVLSWKRKGIPQATFLLLAYFLNPLVIIEGIGNLHIEIVMVALLILMYDAFSENKYRSAAFWYCLAIATKLLPLLLLPYLYLKIPKEQKSRFFIFGGICLFLMFLPITLGLDLINLSKSVNLYFQKFEFNASVYYVLRWLGKLISGYNLILYIGPLLALSTFLLIVKNALNKSSFGIQPQFAHGIFAFGMFLLLSTTVHPWYVITLVFFAGLLDLKTPLIWSFLITLTYINYSLQPYEEQLWVVAIEYGIIVICLFVERKKWLNIEGKYT
ncbi:MAG: hypothetical protein IPL23_12730 [Saprospiraceae bacterium]|nr:hypothetical protein [Saprospiraceae bacterium]